MYVAIDEESRIVAAYEEFGEGLIWCEDIVSPNVLTITGTPKYRYRDGRAIMRTVVDMLADEPIEHMPGEIEVPETEPAPGHQTDVERIAALEEELKAAKILLGLEV